ncbi:MAG: DUF4129 domain-containing protein [Nostocoides sp.]
MTRIEPGEGPPLDPSAEQAREWLAAELATAEYRNRPSPWQRLLDWLQDLLSGCHLDAGAGAFSLRWVFVLLLMLLAAGLAYAALRPVTRTRAGRDRAQSGPVLDSGDTRTAAQLRRAAAAALAAGAYDGAVLNAYRALARGAIERTVLADLPGRTADEVGRSLAPAFPSEADALARAVNTFDQVRYGAVAPSRDAAADVVALDERIAATRPLLHSMGVPG